jgi:signal transduction histidine kinase
MHEKRQTIRVNVNVPCSVRHQGRSFDALVVDISLGGARIRFFSSEPVAEFQMGSELTLNLSTNRHRLETQIILRRIIQEEHCEIGVVFQELEGKKLNVVNALVGSLVEDRHCEVQTIEVLGRLIASATHDLKTPLSIAQMLSTKLISLSQTMTEAFEQKSLTRNDLKAFLDKQQEAWDLIHLNTQRSIELVNSLKNVSQDHATMERREFALAPYVKDILTSLGPTFKDSPHAVHMHCNDDIMADSYPGALAQVVTNLVMNAFIHGLADVDEPGSVTINIVQTQGESIRIEIKDTGCGIGEDIRENIFTPFFTTKHDSGGTGLGLSIVQRLVTEDLAGRIECESRVGQGTTFRVELPRRLPAA